MRKGDINITTPAQSWKVRSSITEGKSVRTVVSDWLYLDCGQASQKKEDLYEAYEKSFQPKREFQFERTFQYGDDSGGLFFDRDFSGKKPAGKGTYGWTGCRGQDLAVARVQ